MATTRTIHAPLSGGMKQTALVVVGAVTLYFAYQYTLLVLFRIVTDYVPSEALRGVSLGEMSTAMIWPVWVLPLLAYDVYLQYRER
jgi:hypothetical protein